MTKEISAISADLLAVATSARELQRVADHKAKILPPPPAGTAAASAEQSAAVDIASWAQLIQLATQLALAIIGQIQMRHAQIEPPST